MHPGQSRAGYILIRRKLRLRHWIQIGGFKVSGREKRSKNAQDQVYIGLYRRLKLAHHKNIVLLASLVRLQSSQMRESGKIPTWIKAALNRKCTMGMSARKKFAHGHAHSTRLRVMRWGAAPNAFARSTNQKSRYGVMGSF